MHIIYVDAEKTALDNFRCTVKNYKEVTSLQMFVNADEALKWMENNPVDVAFMDTEIGEIYGIELARQLRTINQNINIIFITANTQYALEAFGVDALGYVLKPYSEEDIKKELPTVGR